MAGSFDRTTERCPACDGHWRHTPECADYEADRAEHPRIYQVAPCVHCGGDLARQAFLMTRAGNSCLKCEGASAD
jgi:hypothetical protein